MYDLLLLAWSSGIVIISLSSSGFQLHKHNSEASLEAETITNWPLLSMTSTADTSASPFSWQSRMWHSILGRLCILFIRYTVTQPSLEKKYDNSLVSYWVIITQYNVIIISYTINYTNLFPHTTKSCFTTNLEMSFVLISCLLILGTSSFHVGFLPNGKPFLLVG